MDKSMLKEINKLSAKIEAITMKPPKIALNEKTLKSLENELGIEKYNNVNIINGLEIIIDEGMKDWNIRFVPQYKSEYIRYKIENKLEW